MRSLRLAVLALGLGCATASAQWNAHSLGSFGVATLPDESVAQRLRTRFHAAGAPIFLLGNPTSGLQQGDILRFRDRAFLVDADVWQTLATEGALKALRQSPVVRLQASANPGAWSARARIVKGVRERKLYEFGSNLLRDLDRATGGVPDGQKMFFSLEGGQLLITAPAAFLDKLKSVAGPAATETPREKPVPRGRPRWIGAPPAESLWVGEGLDWIGWARDDSGGPTTDFGYEARGDLPGGIRWDPIARRICGTPVDTGSFRIALVAEDELGSDSLIWRPRVRKSPPPGLLGEPSICAAGRAWSFRATPWSERFPGSRIEIVPDSMPSGMVWDSALRTLSWTPSDSQVGAHSFSLDAMDPAKGRFHRAWSVSVVARRDLQVASRGVRVDLPWDTLLERRSYGWNPGWLLSQWNRDGIVLDSVDGDGDPKWDGAALVFRPTRPGTLALRFHFRVGESLRVVEETLPVRPYLPPRFRGWVGGSVLHEGEVRTYRPDAEDPQGGPVAVTAEIPADAPIAWDGTILTVSPRSPGAWSVLLRAKDSLGNQAQQRVAFQCAPRWTRTPWIETRWEAGMQPWMVGWDLGPGRIGLFTPDLERMIGWRTLIRQDWPFLFGGVDFLGVESRRAGNSLGLDLGLTLRFPDENVLTGGFMGRLHGTARTDAVLPVVFEGEILAWIRQGMMLTDSTSFWGMIYSRTGMGTDSADDERYGRILDRIMADDFEKRNLVLFSRLEGWVPLAWDIWGGLGLWRQDIPLANRYEQRVGPGLRWRPSGRFGEFEASIRTGWGPARSGWSAWGDLRWSGGILP